MCNNGNSYNLFLKSNLLKIEEMLTLKTALSIRIDNFQRASDKIQ